MRIQHLRECIKLSQNLNFTQTAREFFITQPVLSKHISALEKDLGITIFVRNQHGVTITPEGELFIKDAASIVEKYDIAVEKAHEANAGISQTITLGYLSGPSKGLLPRAIASFSKARPDITLNLVSLEVDEIIDSIDSDRIDAGLTTSFDNDAVLSNRYGWRPLFKDEIILVAKRDHPLAKKDAVSIYDLAGETFICPASQFMKREYEKMERILDPVKDRIGFRRIMYDLESIPLAMASGDYVQLGFRHFERTFGSHFAYIPITDCANLCSYIGLVWKKDRESQAILTFAATLAEALETAKPSLPA